MKNTWIDLTDIEQWTGHHGGTQRVVYGIAKNYYINDKNARYFVYSPIKNIFYETSFTPIYERVEQLKNQSLLNQTANNTLRQKIKKKLLHYAPVYIKNNKLLKNQIKYTAKKTIGLAREVNNARVKYVSMMFSRATSNDMPALEFSANDIVLILGKPWDNPGLQKLLREQKSRSDFKVVQVVYDLIISLYPHLHHPSLFKSYTQHMFDAVAISDLMLPISRSSERDLKKFCELLNLPTPETSVIRLGDEIDLGEKNSIIDESKPDDRIAASYLLCVGTIENRKNHGLLYQTYKLAAERGVDLPQLVIVGGRGWLADDVQYLITHDNRMKEKMIILNNISDSSLSWLYNNCLFTVYPSLYEGWGLPVAESLAYGKLCVSSNVSSMPEIAGNMIEYFSPNSTDECLKALQVALDDKKRLNKEMIIADKYKTTNWSATYRQVNDRIRLI